MYFLLRKTHILCYVNWLCISYQCVRAGDGGDWCSVDPGDPDDAGRPVIHLHPGHQCLPGSSHRRHVPHLTALEEGQWAGMLTRTQLGMSLWYPLLGLLFQCCCQVKSLQLIWRLGTRKFRVWVPNLQTSCRDLTIWLSTKKVVRVMAAQQYTPFPWVLPCCKYSFIRVFIFQLPLLGPIWVVVYKQSVYLRSSIMSLLISIEFFSPFLIDNKRLFMLSLPELPQIHSPCVNM